MKERRIPREEDIEELKEDLPIPTRRQATTATSAASLFEVVEIATQTDMLIQNSKTGEKFNALQMLALIKNDLEEIKKSL